MTERGCVEETAGQSRRQPARLWEESGAAYGLPVRFRPLPEQLHSELDQARPIALRADDAKVPAGQIDGRSAEHDTVHRIRHLQPELVSEPLKDSCLFKHAEGLLKIGRASCR